MAHNQEVRLSELRSYISESRLKKIGEQMTSGVCWTVPTPLPYSQSGRHGTGANLPTARCRCRDSPTRSRVTTTPVQNGVFRPALDCPRTLTCLHECSGTFFLSQPVEGSLTFLGTSVWPMEKSTPVRFFCFLFIYFFKIFSDQYDPEASLNLKMVTDLVHFRSPT
jgi:hypothetical protein